MRRWLAIILLAVPTVAGAQTSIDLNTANFYWDWVQGTEGPVTEFRIKCGPTAGVYPNVTVVPNPAARSFPVKNAIGGSGLYHCVMVAVNLFQLIALESPPTADLFFAAGVSPSSPSNFRLTP